MFSCTNNVIKNETQINQNIEAGHDVRLNNSLHMRTVIQGEVPITTDYGMPSGVGSTKFILLTLLTILFYKCAILKSILSNS